MRANDNKYYCDICNKQFAPSKWACYNKTKKHSMTVDFNSTDLRDNDDNRNGDICNKHTAHSKLARRNSTQKHSTTFDSTLSQRDDM